MEFSFRLADKYFWTTVDFWRLQPVRFAAVVLDNSKRYIPAFQFWLASVLIGAAEWTIHFSIFAALFKTGAEPALFGSSVTNVKLLVLLVVFIFLSSGIVGAFLTAMVVKVLLRSPAGATEVIKGYFYSVSALFVAMTTLIVIEDLALWEVAQSASEQTIVHIALRVLLVNSVIMFPANFYYDVATTCAFTRMKRRRLVEALAICLPCLALLLCTVQMFRFLLVTTDEFRSLPLAASIVMVLSIASLVWYGRRRLPKLRRLVRAEFNTYRR